MIWWVNQTMEAMKISIQGMKPRIVVRDTTIKLYYMICL